MKKTDNREDEKMYARTAYNTYAQNNVQVESPAKLIEMLYEGVLRFNSQAKNSIIEGNIEKKVYWLNRSIAVIAELKSCLDFSQGDIAAYLDGLYSYEMQLLNNVNLDNDQSKLDECTNVFRGLLEAWRETTNVD